MTGSGTRKMKNGTFRMVNVAMPLDLFEELERRAIAEDRNLSRQVVFYVRAALSSPDHAK